ncbi:MAG: HflK protein, partial [Deltaproteobacteria bacterium]|nr:HflK protein [Deltaproteobacteria bacterium]
MSWDPEVFRSDGAGKTPGEILEEAFSRFKAPSGRTIGLIALAVLVAVGLATSYYQVEPDEVGVLRRLGKYTGTSDPGPHFRLPFGIE